MLVNSTNLKSCVAQWDKARVLAIDTETTGLNPYDGDELFMISIAIGGSAWCIDARDWGPTQILRTTLNRLLTKPDLLVVGHNIKFDMHFLHKWGVEITSPVWCTEVMARVENNIHLSYKLADCAKRIGLEKSDAVKAYCLKYGLWEWETVPGKKARNRKFRYNQVPQEIIVPYAEQDALVTYALYESQKKNFELIEIGSPKSLWPTLKLEMQTTPVLFRMERQGIQIDKEYCTKALEYEKKQADNFKETIEALIGTPFVDSAKALSEVLPRFGVPLGKTEKGAPSVSSDVLSAHPCELTDAILSYRKALKRAGTYFSSFIHFANSDNKITANIRQGKAATGRFSCATPNLQNLIDESEDGDQSPYPVRRAFVASKDYSFLSLDYTAMEYYLMLDYASELKLIEKVKAGMDIHEATAHAANTVLPEGKKITRKQAKTVNFLMLYGGGLSLLAQRLGCGEEEAATIKAAVTAASPDVARLIKTIVRRAEVAKVIHNWNSRRYSFPDRKWAYKGPNYLIQGGCADIMRVALVECDKFLTDYKSKLCLTVHDDIKILMHVTEHRIIPEIKRIMESAYKYSYLPMKVSISTGNDLHNLKEWDGTKIRNNIQGEGVERSEEDSRCVVL